MSPTDILRVFLLGSHLEVARKCSLMLRVGPYVAAGLEKIDFYQLKCIAEQYQIAIAKLQVINRR